MHNFTRLSRPPQPATTPISQAPSSDELNYPSFRLLNRQARVTLSPGRLDPNLSNAYHLFSVANTKGWFVAATVREGASALIFSPLSDLRTAAEAGNESLFTPSRTVQLAAARPNIITFACSEALMLVGIHQGQILVYDTARLFVAGSDEVVPLTILHREASTPPRQIVPNPSRDSNLAPLVAVLRGDQRVEILNVQTLESQGGWVEDSDVAPAAVAWSPKGKQLAIGLQTGDVLTFTLTDKSTPQKHIPGTAPAPLVSLNWLGPGHTFRTSYSSSDPSHHIVSLDTQSSTTNFTTLLHPFPISGRNQGSLSLVLSNWDLSFSNPGQGSSGEGSKTLLVIGDVCSTDIEIIGNIGAKWDQRSRDDNPVAIPLDKDYDDTILLSLDVDLTAKDPVHIPLPSGESVDWPPAPIVYAYLNDGTVQAWHVAHSTMYSGMITPPATATPFGASSTPNQAQPTPASSSNPPASPLQQQVGTPAPIFGQGSQPTSVFGRPSQPASVFGQPSPTTSVFGQHPSPSAFGQPSGFGQPTSVFGQQPQSQSTFASGQASSPPAFGQSSAFGQLGSSNAAFGQQQPSPGPGFGQPSAPVSGFGQSSTPSSTFGQGSFGEAASQNKSLTTSSPAFGSSSSGVAFSSFASAGPSKFGQAVFGFGSGAPSPAPASDATTPAPTQIESPAEESMMSDSGPSFGGLSLGVVSSDSDSKSKPAFGNSIFGLPASAPSPLPLPPDHSANQPSSFEQGAGAIKPATGFGAFSNYTQQSHAATAGGSDDGGKVSAALSGFGGAKPSPASAFGQPAFGQPAFGQSTFGQPAFGKPTFGQATFGKPSLPSAPVATPSTGGFGAFAKAGPTTFGSASQQGGSGADTKPSWSTGGGSSAFGGGSEQTKPVDSTGGGNLSSSPFGGKSAFSGGIERPRSPFAPGGSRGESPFGGGGSISGEKKSSSTPANPSPFAPISPASSPESPSLRRSPSPFSNKDSPPAPSPFQSRSPAPTTSAFGQLKASSSGFKPATGFGAFGSDTTPTSSPFFKAAAVNKPPPVSAFANLGSSVPPPVVATSGSAFGATSVLGSGSKSVFAPASPPTPTPAKTATTSGAFGAYSGSMSGFGAFTGPQKSFGELLKTDDNARDPEKQRTPAFTTPHKDAATASETPLQTTSKTPVSVFGPRKEDNDKPTSAFSPLTSRKQPEISENLTPIGGGSSEEKEKPTVPPSVTTTPSKAVPPFPDPIRNSSKRKGPDSDSDDGKANIDKGPSTSAPVSDEPSFGSLSLSSQTSSFVEVSDPESNKGAEVFSSDKDADGDLDNEETLQEHEDDDAQSFLSESFSSDDGGSDGPPEGETSEEETDSLDSISPEPSTIPLPISRSPSATPQAEIPIIRVSISPKPTSESSRTSSSPTAKEGSTTPPGSPIKETPPVLSKSPILAPAPALPTASTPPFGLGLGRPSTRPTRSSPLANAPVSGDDDNNNDKPKSAPPLKLHPASPKTPFGLWAGAVKIEPLDEPKASGSKQPRPKTPPLLSSFAGPQVSVESDLPSQPLSTTPPQLKSSTPPAPTTLNINLFGNIVPPSNSPTPTPSLGGKISTPSTTPSPTALAKSPAPPSSPSPNVFGETSTQASGSKVSTPQFGLFGSKPAAPPTPSTPFSLQPSASASPTPPTRESLFGVTPSSSSPTLFKTNTPSATTPAIAPTPVQPPLEPSLEEGMQAECAYLFSSLARELENLRLLAEEASKKKAAMSKSAGGSRRKSDLSDSSKWSLSDVMQFGQTMRQFEQDILELKEKRAAQLQSLRELQSNMLKAGTRREEIARFNKAKTDTEFAKMLKARTLGPEHLETQTQLRRNIRAMHDRILKLEDHLQAFKKKLNQVTTGKPGLRAPSLDTINRTYRNIDVALQQQADDVAILASRISKLNVAVPLLVSPTRDARLPDPVSKRPFNVTPHVAVTTAAALNAERSAQKLKRALMAVRKEPLLNTKATSAPTAPIAFDTPKPLVPSGFTTLMQQTPLPDWNLPEEFNPSPTPTVRRGAGFGFKRQRSVPLKKSSPAGQSPPAPNFDWGPLPTFAPLKTMATPVKPQKPISPDNSLDGSWIADDFSNTKGRV